jgi:competence protein ComEA
MTLYTRPQLAIVLLLVGAAGAGLAIDHWRRARPDLADRLERHDRAAAENPMGPPPAEAARRPLRHLPGALRDPAPCGDNAGARCRPSASTAPSMTVDVNRASEAELAGLPGIGSALASRIVAARPFAEVDELQRVRGLRRATLERLRPLVTAGAATLHRD